MKQNIRLKKLLRIYKNAKMKWKKTSKTARTRKKINNLLDQDQKRE